MTSLKKYLMLDTSSDALTIALAQKNPEDEALVLLEEQTQILSNQHGVTLLPTIQQVIANHQWKANDITDIWVGRGPGSYTGLRIGLTLAKMWAQVHPVTVKTMSSLALMAAQTPREDVQSWIVPVMDARRMTAYTNIYCWNHQGRLQAVLKDQHIAWDSWCQTLIQQAQAANISHIYFVGKDIDNFVQAFKEKSVNIGSEWLDDQGNYPKAASSVYIDDLLLVSDIHTLTPNYAHVTLVEQEWAQKNDQIIANEDDHERFIEHFSGH